MTARWIPCGSGFIEADVIRWTEGVWRKPRRNRRALSAVSEGDLQDAARRLDAAMVTVTPSGAHRAVPAKQKAQ